MTLYLDASALVKRYVDEEGSDLVIEAMSEASAWAICRIGYVEVARAVGIALGKRGAERFEADWSSFEVVEVDHELAAAATRLALGHRLRSLDALHLAAAQILPSAELTVATWDVRLHQAARDADLAVLPVQL